MRFWLLIGSLALAPSVNATVHVKDVRLLPDSGGWRIDIKASAKTPYKVHTLPEPDRLLIDIPDATLDINSRVKAVDAPGSPTLRFSQFSRNPDVVRVVVNVPAQAGLYREMSAAPAMNIALFLPAKQHVSPELPALAAAMAVRPVPVAKTAPARAKSLQTAKSTAQPTRKPSSETVTARAEAPRSKASRVTRPARSVHPTRPAEPDVISARELEQRLKDAGVLVESPRVNPATVPALPDPRVSRAERPALPGPRLSRAAVSRSSVASRRGAVDRSHLLATLLSPTPEPTIEPVVPAWSPEDAVALIRSGDCPEPLRRRLIEVVSDPAIQTSRYVWGAETPGQFDCSGLALYIYGALDVKLPRCSWQQCEVGLPVDRESLQAGDLVFFITRGKNVSHVGIYLGEGRFLHAANPHANLQVTSLDSPYYAKRFAGARRVFGIDAADAGATETQAIGG